MVAHSQSSESSLVIYRPDHRHKKPYGLFPLSPDLLLFTLGLFGGAFIRAAWIDADKAQLLLPMALHLQKANDNSNKVSVMNGPG